MKKFNLNRPPKYEELKNILRADILEGKYKPDKPFPSQNELSIKYKIGKTTVREAVGALVHEGLLYRKQGKGSFLAERMGNIGLIVGKQIELKHPAFRELIRGITKVVSASERHLTFIFADKTTFKHRGLERTINELKINGLIIPSMRPGLIRKNDLAFTIGRFPVVFINDGLPEISPYLVEVESGTHLAIKYLLKEGRRKIALILSPLKNAKEDKTSYEKIIKEYGMQVNPQLIISGEYSFKSGYELVKKFLNSKNPPDAYLAPDDSAALGVITALKEAGFLIPKDVSIIGQGDFLSAFNIFGLSSIRIPFYRIGQETSKMLLKIISGDIPRKTKISLKTELILRESTFPSKSKKRRESEVVHILNINSSAMIKKFKTLISKEGDTENAE